MNEAKKIYQSIKAPDELREKVLGRQTTSSVNKSRKVIRRAAALAACLVLAVTAFAFTVTSHAPSVIFDGQTVGENAVKVYAESASQSRAREAGDIRILLELKAKKAEVIVSMGRIITRDGTEITTLDCSETVYWELSPGEIGETQTLKLKSDGKDSVYTLTFNQNSEYYLSENE